MNIVIDPLFKNWNSVTDGSGSTSVTSGTLTADSNISEKGYLTSLIAPAPGETYIFSCEARVLSNNGIDPNPGMFVDYPALQTAANQINFDDSGQWRRYEITFTVPIDGESVDAVVFGAGSWSSTDGSAEIRLPRVRSLTTSPMSQNIWASAVVQISTGGTLTVVEECNIESISWVSGGGSTDSRIFVQVPGIDPSLNQQPRPRAFVSTTAADGYIAVAPHFITGGTNGQFNVLIFDAVAGSNLQVNPSESTYVSIEVVY